MRMDERLRDELAWWSFFLPRQALQTAARYLPLDKLRDSLPPAVGARLRFGLYPARITRETPVVCVREHRGWGVPAELDPAKKIAYAEKPRVTILMVTYGNLALTRLCLRSVQEAAGPTPFELVVVDNRSPDATPAYLERVAKQGLLPMRVFLNQENLGFAGGNNQAAREATGEILVFLNNDTIVTPGWLERLVAHLDRNPSLGLVGPVTNSCGNEAEIPCRYTDPEQMLSFAAEVAKSHPGELGPISMLTLFCAAMPAALFKQVGGLDERYRIGMFEDDDLSMGVEGAGRNVRLARDTFVHHYGGAAFSRLPQSQYLRIWWENRRRFERKWHRPWRKR